MKQIIFIAILLTCAFGASSDNDGDESVCKAYKHLQT